MRPPHAKGFTLLHASFTNRIGARQISSRNLLNKASGTLRSYSFVGTTQERMTSVPEDVPLAAWKRCVLCYADCDRTKSVLRTLYKKATRPGSHAQKGERAVAGGVVLV